MSATIWAGGNCCGGNTPPTPPEGNFVMYVDNIPELQGLVDLVDGQQISLAGSTLGGDGDGRTYYYDANSVATVDGETVVAATGMGIGRYIVANGFKQTGIGTVLRTYQAKLKDVVNVRDFGATGKGLVSDTANFVSALTAIDLAGGGTLVIPPGDYLIGAPGIRKFTSTSDLTIIFEGGAKLIAAAGLSTPVLQLQAANPGAAATAPPAHTLTIVSPNIDCSAGSYIPSSSSCSALQLAYWKECFVTNVNLYGGEQPDNINADSGIATVSNGYTLIDGGIIRGFADSGIYPGGDNVVGTDGDGKLVYVRNLLIQRCAAAIDAKRELNLLNAANCYFEECLAGIMGNPVVDQAGGTIPFVLGARRIEVHNCFFKKIKANLVRMRSHVRGGIYNCTFEDWGYEIDGTGSVGTNAYAINGQGMRGCEVKGNRFTMKDWPLDLQRAVLITADILEVDGITYNSGFNAFSGNSYRGIQYAVVEEAGGDPNAYGIEFVRDLTAAPVNAVQFNPLSAFAYLEDGIPEIQVYRGSQNYTTPQFVKGTVAIGDIDLSSLGTLGAGAVSSPLSVPIANMFSGAHLILTFPTASLANSPFVSVRARPIPNNVQITAYNAAGTGFDFTGEIVRVYAFRTT